MELLEEGNGDFGDVHVGGAEGDEERGFDAAEIFDAFGGEETLSD